MPDVKLLAEALALLLAPVLPTLLSAGGKAAGKAVEEIGKQAGGAVSGKVQDLWDRIRGKVEEKPAASGAAEEVALAPEDEDAVAALRLQLRKILEADPVLAVDLAPRIEAARSEIQVTTVTQVQARDQAALAYQGGVAAQGTHAVAIGGSAQGGIHFHQAAPAPPPPPTGRTDPSALRANYLKSLMEEVGRLSLEGIDPAAAGDAEARMSLDAVYTGLRTLSPDDDREGRGRLLSALEQLNRHRRLVLLGDPGGGKSTFVHFVALCHAGAILGHPQIHLDLLRAPLPLESQQKKPRPQPWEHGPLLPVRVVLRDFAARGLPPPSEPVTALDLQTFLEKSLEKACHGEYVPFLFQELRETGGLLLFDGLDEVPEAEHCRDRLRKAVEEFVRSFGKCRVLLTSRTYAYRGQGWRLDDFTEAELAPFDRDQIRCFVERWYAQVAASGRLAEEEAQGRAQLLLQAVLGNDRLKGLAERPLLLTLMASLHTWRGGSLPERREQLYADAVELLLNLWENQRVIRDPDGTTRLMQPSLAQYLAIGKNQVRQVLEELAFEMHSRGDLAGTADVPQGELVGRLMGLRSNPDTNPAELVKYLSQRAGLLVPRGVGVFTFPHRTFQEYLAACHLTVKGFPRELAALGRQDPGRWREVVLLAGAKAARGAPFATWSLAGRLCPHEPAESLEADDVWGAHLAGQVIAESAELDDLDETDGQILERFRRWHLRLLGTDLLPASERALAGRTLARLGDPRPEVMTLDAMQLCRVPAGPFRMGSEEEQHVLDLPYEFQMSRYPVTVAQFQEYVKESGNQPGELNSLRGPRNAPVVRVSWYEALAFCCWLTVRWRGSGRIEQGWSVTLPSEAEWEKAARGPDGRVYPWGKDADPEKANYAESGISGTSAVGCFPRGKSPYGCEEMSGNVLEWTRSLWGKDHTDAEFRYPYLATDGREDIEASREVRRVWRGGCYFLNSSPARCAYRNRQGPDLRLSPLGFRVCVVPIARA